MSDAGQPVVAESSGDVSAQEVIDSLPVDDQGIESGDEGSDVDASDELSIDAAEATGEISKKEAQVLKKKLKLKVDGEEIEEEVNFEDEEGLKRHLQKSKAFDKRVKEYSQYKSQVDQVLEMLKNDPVTLLEKMGYNVDDMAEKHLAKKIEELKKSPQEIEAEKMRKELEEYKKKEKESSERAQKAELEKMKNEQAAQIENDISSALDDVKSILPKKNPAVMQRIAQTMLLAMQKGFHNVTAKDVIPLVEKQYKEEFSSLLGSSSDEVLEALATKERLSNYRKAQVQQKKNVPKVAKPVIQDTGASKTKREEKPQERFSMRDFLKVNPNK